MNQIENLKKTRKLNKNQEKNVLTAQNELYIATQ